MTQARHQRNPEPSTSDGHVLQHAGDEQSGDGGRARPDAHHGANGTLGPGRRPKPLNTTQVNPVSGGVNWPSALQQPGFDDQRNVIDQLLAKQARYGVLDYTDQTTVRKTIDAMFDQLKAQIDQIPPMDYVACRSFLRSVNYAATKTEM